MEIYNFIPSLRNRAFWNMVVSYKTFIQRLCRHTDDTTNIDLFNDYDIDYYSNRFYIGGNCYLELDDDTIGFIYTGDCDSPRFTRDDIDTDTSFTIKSVYGIRFITFLVYITNKLSPDSIDLYSIMGIPIFDKTLYDMFVSDDI